MRGNKIESVTTPDNEAEAQGMSYVLGYLRGSSSSEVRTALNEAVCGAMFRCYAVPDWLVEDTDVPATMTPKWIDRQLHELAPQLLHHSSNNTED